MAAPRKLWELGPLTFAETVRDGTNSEKAVYLLFENRKLKELGPTTYADACKALGFSETTFKRAFSRLRRGGVVIEAEA